MSYMAMQPLAFLRYALEILLNFSWPAVSQSCSFRYLPSILTILVLMSIPTVELVFSMKILSLNRSSSDVLPIALSPIMIIL